MSTTVTLETEAALQSVYFATRHLDQAATIASSVALDRPTQEQLQVARFHATAALRALADHLCASSEARLIGDAAVPF